MIEHYHLPSAKVLSAQRIEEVATVVVEISRHDYLGYPIAPADLWRLDSNESIWPFHQLVGRDGPRFVFETYDVPSPLPQVGLTWDFCSRWLPDAMDAVRDKSISWELLLAPVFGTIGGALNLPPNSSLERPSAAGEAGR